MRGSVGWPISSFLCSLCFFLVVNSVTTLPEIKPHFSLTTGLIVPCWSLHVGPAASSLSQASSSEGIIKKQKGVSETLFSSESPTRKETATPSRLQQLLKWTAYSRDTLDRAVLRGTSHSQKSFFEEGGNRKRSTSQQTTIIKGKRPSAKSFVEENNSSRASEGRGVAAAADNGRKAKSRALDSLSPARLLDPAEYAIPLRAEVHGGFTEHRTTTKQEKREGCSHRGSFPNGCGCSNSSVSRGSIHGSRSSHINSDSSNTLGIRMQKWPPIATANNEVEAAALSEAFVSLKAARVTSDKRKGGVASECRRQTGMNGARISDGDMDGCLFSSALHPNHYIIRSKFPAAFLQETEKTTPVEEEEGKNARTKLDSHVKTSRATDGISVRRADMPIAKHADALVQRAVSVAQEERINVAGEEGGDERTWKAEQVKDKGNTHHRDSRAVLLQRDSATLAPKRTKNDPEVEEDKQADKGGGGEKEKQNSEQSFTTTSLLGMNTPASAKNPAAVHDEEEWSRHNTSSHFRKEIKEAGRGHGQALLQATVAAAASEEDDEEEGEEEGETEEAGGEEGATATEHEEAQSPAATAKGAPDAAEKEGGKEVAGPYEEHEEGEDVSTKEAVSHEKHAEALAPEEGKAAGAIKAEMTETTTHTEGKKGKGGTKEHGEGLVGKAAKEEKPEKGTHVERKTVTETVISVEKKGQKEEQEEKKEHSQGEDLAAMLRMGKEKKDEKKKHLAELGREEEKHAKEKAAPVEVAKQTAPVPTAGAKEAGMTVKEKEEQKHKENMDAALKTQEKAEEKLEEPSHLLVEHHLAAGGPRGVTPVHVRSYISAQDELQHKQLMEASDMATRLTAHLERQQELKLQEMHLKRREMAHINQLRHFERALQSIISTVWKKLDGLQEVLKRMVHHTKYIGDKFLRRTGHRVLLPEETPITLHPTPAEAQQLVSKTSRGMVEAECPTDHKFVEVPLQQYTQVTFCRGNNYVNSFHRGPHVDARTTTQAACRTLRSNCDPLQFSPCICVDGCAADCLPSACDNKPATPSQCFKFMESAGGGGYRTCEPFSDPETATCPEGYTRCAMAAPVRGSHYELFESLTACALQTPKHRLPQPLIIHGRNLSTCLRLLTVHEETKCSPDSSHDVEEALQDAKNVRAQPAPHILEDAVLFENVEYWVPPGAKPGDKVYVLGIDEIGTLTVLPMPGDELFEKLRKEEEERRDMRKMEEEKSKEKKAREEEKEKEVKEKKEEARMAEHEKERKEEEVHEKSKEAAQAGHETEEKAKEPLKKKAAAESADEEKRKVGQE